MLGYRIICLWRFVISASFALACVIVATPSYAEPRILIDGQAARATLIALGNPNLGQQEAESIARLPGNQAMIRKMEEMGVSASTASFAQALRDAAADRASPVQYGFKAAKANRDQALAMVDRFVAPDSAFVDAVRKRIAEFAPRGVDGAVAGFLIAGGPVDGFSFTEPAFFVDVVRLRGDHESAIQLLAHELFHGVQNLGTKGRFLQMTEYRMDHYASLGPPERDCYVAQILFGNLMAEGAATLVGDGAAGEASTPESLIGRLHLSPAAMQARIDLLETLLKAGTGADPISIDRLYGIGFYSYFSSGRPALYDLGEFMAAEIAKDRGNLAIGELAISHPSAFVRAYQELASKASSQLPKLGPIAASWARDGRCPSSQ